MNIQLDLQHISQSTDVPTEKDFEKWVSMTVADYFESAELTIRLVDNEEMRYLNQQFRRKSGVTNVLAFPFEKPEGVELDVPLLGDLVICVPQVIIEAKAQHKTVEAHWAHLVIHGCLHLLGFDHETSEEADIMEAREIALLAQLGFTNPYSGDDAREG